jgi:hypothetical protein
VQLPLEICDVAAQIRAVVLDLDEGAMLSLDPRSEVGDEGQQVCPRIHIESCRIFSTIWVNCCARTIASSSFDHSSEIAPTN